MYETSVGSQMGCSVKEIISLNNCDVKRLKSLIHPAINICVTSGYQQKEHNKLKAAGYVQLVKYKNYAVAHQGNVCILWAAFGKRCKEELLPEKPKPNVVLKIVNETKKKKKK